MTETQIKTLYQEYLEDFDPTPDYAYDGYKIPLDLDEFTDCITHNEDPYDYH